MKSLPNDTERSELIWQLRSRRIRLHQLIADHPAVFRAVVRLQRGGPRLGSQLLDWQRKDFQALDSGWLTVAGRPQEQATLRAYIERPRGHSKTTDLAVQLAWILQASPRTVRGLAAAADREQAALLHAAVSDLIRNNPQLLPDLQARQFDVRHRGTGSTLSIIASDVRSSWGLLPDFVICDELCHWADELMWQSLLSSAAKRPTCLLVVLTNAGVGTGWAWQVRQAARQADDWYFSSLDGPRAPWITERALAEQRRMLPPAVYARLWLNQWQHSDGEFVTLDEVTRCVDERLAEQSRGRPGVTYFAAIDYAEKHDRTVATIVHREGDVVVVDRMDVVSPTPTNPTPVQWVERWIEMFVPRFALARIVVDEFQLLDLVQRLESRYPIERFEFASGRGNHRLAIALRQLVIEQRVRWYRACGALDAIGTDHLEHELASLIVRQSGQGRLRFDHRPGEHDDRAFALAVACCACLETSGAQQFLEVTPPARDGDFAWT